MRRRGSSPLSRGIPACVVASDRGGGIIPALAGNTWTAGMTGCGCSDHPRSRGEYLRSVGGSFTKYGSSPLSRGIPSGRGSDMTDRRIIPALAGNTGTCPVQREIRTDHPRSRGEYLVSPPLNISPSGSSPLSRGIPGAAVKPLVRAGIIPALAGNTCGAVFIGTCRWDHPRSRGEYYLPDEFAVFNNGSSPLSRGIPGLRFPGSWASRIIPALAGNTYGGKIEDIYVGDHPRSRGEYSERSFVRRSC